MIHARTSTDASLAYHPQSASVRDTVILASDLLPLFDFLCLLLTMAMSTLIYSRWPVSQDFASQFGETFQQATWTTTLCAPFILYDKRFGQIAYRGEVSPLIFSHGLRFTFFSLLLFMLGSVNQSLKIFPTGWLIIWFVTCLLLTSLARILIACHLRYLRHRGELTEVIAIIGAGPTADRLVAALHESSATNFELLGVFDDKIVGAVPSSIKSSGNLARLIELGKSQKIDWIIMTLPSTAEQRLMSIVKRMNALPVPIGLYAQHADSSTPCRVVEFVGNGVPVSLLVDRPIKHWYAALKDGQDFLFGIIITLLLMPVLLAIAVAIRIDSPGPIIFRQSRHAVNNREFHIYKFRTMRWDPTPDSTALKQTTRQDGRVTAVGRFLRASSLDELPQLFNVLKGEMSLVGPRPHAVNMRTEQQLGPEITSEYAHRHRVKPGITGWAQVNGARGATDTVAQLQRRIELDLHYINNWSLLLDLKILVRTAGVVFKSTNAY